MRIFCIGRNYAAHAQELGNATIAPDEQPMIFMKPATALVTAGSDVPWPRQGGELHFETELVVSIGRDGFPVDEAEALSYIGGFTLGIDLTLRDVQQRCKEQGHPWERAKAFDHSALCGTLVPAPWQRFIFTGSINGELRQTGDTNDMIFPVPRLLVELAQVWELRTGDLIYTGTPAGVGPLQPGDILIAECPTLGRYEWRM